MGLEGFFGFWAADSSLRYGLQAAGNNILEMLAGQRQTLNHARATQQETQENLTMAQKILKRMW